MELRDRIRELRRVPAGELRRNDKNWRTHPPAQTEALRKMLAEVGFAGALLARECEDGSLELIDGHLRADLAPEAVVPVLVLDVNEAEANQILATHDPIGGMGQGDEACFAALRETLEKEKPELRKLLDAVSLKAIRRPSKKCRTRSARKKPIEIPESYELVVTCADEADQERVYEQLTGQGYACRVLTM